MERKPTVVTEFVKVARLDQVGPGQGAAFTIADDAIALFNVRGRLYATEDACMRCGASLASGSRHDTDLACPACSWHYDLATGRVVGLPGLKIDTFEVRIVDSDVLLAIETPPGR